MSTTLPSMYSMAGGGRAQRSEGADVETSTLSGVALTATGQGSAAEYTSWACTDCPTVGDLEFPTGTSTGAVNSAIADSSAPSTTVNLPGPGRYEFTASWSDGTTETLTVRATRPVPACALAWVSGAPAGTGVATAGASFSFTLSDANSSDSAGFSASMVKYSGGGAVSLTESPEGTFAGTWPAQVTGGISIRLTGTTTDAYGRTADVAAAYLIEGTSADPPVLTAPAENTSDLDDADPAVSFTNAGASITSSSATIFSKPSGSSATVANSSPSLSVTLSPDVPGVYVVEFTGTNGDGSAKSYATFNVSALAPTAEAGANPQHSGGAKSLDGSGSTAAAGRTIAAYAWTVASNSPNSATLTDANTATPDFTAVLGETYILSLTVTDSEGETDTDTVSVFPAASVVTHYDIDLTTATADASLADGDTIYESDGTTAIGTMRIGDGTVSGTTNLLASIGSGGLEFEAELTSGSYTWPHCSFNLDSTNIAWTTDVVVVQLQYRVESIGNKTYEGIGATFGEDGRPRTTGSGHNWACMVIDSDSRKERAQDYPGNAAYNFGTDQATGATLPQEYVCAFVVHAGTIVYCYWRRGTTLFNGVPDPSDSDVYVQAFAETNAVGVSESKNFGNEIAVGLHGINYTAGAGAGPIAQLKRVKITSAGPGRD